MSGQSRAYVDVEVDTGDAPRASCPKAGDYAWKRPTLFLPGGVQVDVRKDDDASAAAWWRQLAAACEEAAEWYDKHPVPAERGGDPARVR